ncbi:MAG TPA: DNA gyrase inhibitor YacG [Candidatus Acidoferrum sp.]
MKHKCPICKAETDSAIHADFPFCSERCRERDLGNWASEKYVVSEPIFTEEDAQEGERNTIVLDLNSDSDHSNDADH